MNVSTKPNFLFILSDDQGYWSLGCYGNREVHSPVLDKLAAEGARFDNFYCVSPVCSPARASILTGQIPSHHGVLDWLGGGAVNKEDYKDIMLPREKILENLAEDIDPEELDSDATELPFSLTRNYRRYMANEKGPIRYLNDFTFTEKLAQSGYRCGISGKWHLGSGNESQAGFSFWSVVPRGGTPYMMPDWICNNKIHIGDQYVTDLITDEAIRFLQEQDDHTPFYLSVHYTAPHDPWRKGDHPEDIWKLYNNCPFESIPNVPLHPNQVMKRIHPKSEEHRRELVQAYYTSITAMDQNIGRILEYLTERGLLDNTIVIFTSDNGMNLGHHGIWGKGNGTYPMNLYETSVKIPFIMWNPKYVAAQQAIQTPLSHYDLFPTLLSLTGVSSDDIHLPGRRFDDLLCGNENSVDRKIVVFDEYGPVRMIRQNGWKLIWNYLDNTCELYQLQNDPDEQHDLAGDLQNQSMIQALKNEMDNWFREYGQTAYDAVQYPVNGEGQFAPAPQWHEGVKTFVTQSGAQIVK